MHLKSKINLLLRISVVFFYLSLISAKSYSQNNSDFDRIDSLIYAGRNQVAIDPKEMLNYYFNLKNSCDSINYKLGSAMSEMCMARCYYHLNQPEKGIELTTKVLKEAQKLKNDTLYIYTKVLYAKYLGHAWMNKEAIEILDQCDREVENVKNDIIRNEIQGDIHSLKAIFMAGLKPRPSDRELLNYHLHALQHYELADNRRKMYDAYGNVATYYSSIEELDSAAFYYRKAIEISWEEGYLPNMEYMMLGYMQGIQGNFQLAISYLDSARNMSKGISDNYFLSNLYEAYSSVYDSLNDIDSLQKYQLLETHYNDLLEKSDRDNILSASEHLIESEATKYFSEKRIRIIVMLLSLAIIATATVFIVSFYRKKEKFRKEKFRKDRELLQKTSEIIDLKHKVTHTYDELLELARKNDPLFIPVFKELYPDFYTNLMKVQPDMTVTELKICFCLKLNFTTKEIAQSTFVTIKAIQNRKNRLRKRLHLQEGEDLYKFINELAE